jgi:biotin carboxylase
MRNIVFVAPFPLETTLRFARALRTLDDVKILGVWQEAPRGPDLAVFHDVALVPDGLDVPQLIEAVSRLAVAHGAPFRIIGILEPLQVQLAYLRKHFGVPGPNVETAERFRDKAVMKDMLRVKGLPCARHRLLRNPDDAVAFVKEVGFPIVMKPPAGMASKGTWRLQSEEELADALRASRPSPEHPYLAEEFLRGSEYSFDTVTIDGEVKFHSISEYYPGPLEVMEQDWIQWVCLLPRDVSGPEFDGARRLGVDAVKALGLETGVTHMEWFRRTDGSLAIGEIAARPPGANIVRMIGLAHDSDLYRAWARAVVDGEFDGPWERRWAVGCAFLRGAGRGHIREVQGIAETQKLVGQWVVEAKLPTIGAPKSDSYEGDGYAIVRHPDTAVAREALKTIIERVRIHYA